MNFAWNFKQFLCEGKSQRKRSLECVHSKHISCLLNYILTTVDVGEGWQEVGSRGSYVALAKAIAIAIFALSIQALTSRRVTPFAGVAVEM